jgi:hypothetical protein
VPLFRPYVVYIVLGGGKHDRPDLDGNAAVLEQHAIL